MNNYSDQMKRICALIEEADYVLIGGGSGLSAAGGINYGDPELFEKWYPELKAIGLNTIAHAISAFWKANDKNRLHYWAYWAKHIKNIRYDFPATGVYRQLYRLIKNKNHFVITTNVENQFAKAGFDPEVIYAPQGNYGLFQCIKPCSDTVYQNKEMVETMIANMDTEHFAIREEDVPICPKCGEYLVPNLRVDDTFVEVPHLINQEKYVDFINESTKGKLLLLELGVGYNTPVIIRYPFEQIAMKHDSAALVRINTSHSEPHFKLNDESVIIEEDISKVIDNIMISLEKGYNYPEIHRKNGGIL